MNNSITHRRMPAEWEAQDAILMTLPHAGTDWAPMLPRVLECFSNIARAIVSEMPLIVVSPSTREAEEVLSPLPHSERIVYHEVPTNDTWARDFGPLAVISHDAKERRLLDFTFNGWGMKFAACHDNLITASLAEQGRFATTVENCRDIVLEGGSLESDGAGTLMTTSECLLSPNRNAHLTQDKIEAMLRQRLGARKVLWLNHGALVGDDTDSHIDTLARFAPGNTILYVKCDDPADEQYRELQLMELELQQLTNAGGEPYRLLPLPCPTAIHSDDGERLPATYANFLITNTQVLVPTYDQPHLDALAMATIATAFPTRKVTGIDCRALIEQHGSLHCMTMQIHKGFLKK